MAYSVKKPNIFGQVGEHLGKGLAEAIPKEAERSRLASSLKSLGEEENLDPWKAFTALSSTPGITPQMIQSGTELLKQRSKANSLAGFSNQPINKFPEIPNINNQEQNNLPNSVSRQEPSENVQQGYIPPTKQQDLQKASKLFNQNPAFFQHNPDNAIQYVNEENQRNKEISSESKVLKENLTEIQNNLTEKLKARAEGLNAKFKIPQDTYNKVEQEAIKAIKSKKYGGRGLTEEQAATEYGEKLDEIARQYDSIKNLSKVYPPELLRNVRTLVNEFEKRDDTRNLADEFSSTLGTSPIFSYRLAQSPYKIPELKKELNSMPNLKGNKSFSKDVVMNKEQELFPKLLKAMGKNGSPLAVANELENKGYNINNWKTFLTDHQDDLTGKQIDQLGKNFNLLDPLSDWWIGLWLGEK